MEARQFSRIASAFSVGMMKLTRGVTFASIIVRIVNNRRQKYQQLQISRARKTCKKCAERFNFAPYCMKRVFITGVAGFIGSSLADVLLKEGLSVVGWDDFSTGQEEFVVSAKQ